MKLLNEIITNFQEWHCKVFDDGIAMYSCQSSGNTHRKLRENFKSAFNSFTEGDKTIIVCCFNTYTDIVIFQPSKKNHESKANVAYAS